MWGLSSVRAWLVTASVVAVSACGGGGNAGCDVFTGGGTGCNSGVGASAADITLVLSAPTITNSGNDSVVATVTAVDANRAAVEGISVTLRVDSNATVQQAATATASDGTISGTVKIGNDKTNRVVTVTAISGTIVRTATVQVTGSKLTGTPLPAVLSPGAKGDVSYTLVDSNSNAMSGVAITVTGADGVQTQGVTDSNGSYVYSYTAPATSGTVSIRASAGGDEDQQTILVQSGTGSIPAANIEVRSPSVSANPSVVSTNTNDSSTNQASIRALFLGDSNAPVKNIRVRFDLDGDANSVGGRFTSGTTLVYSNDSGVATTSYVPGTRFSPTDGVTVRACWDYDDFAVNTCPHAVRTTLTVNADALSVSIGTNNKLIDGTELLTYIHRFVVQVVDSSGVAKQDVTVSPSIDLLQYYKGFWSPFNVNANGQCINSQGVVVPNSDCISLGSWKQYVNAVCDNEDLNRNGVVEVFSNGTSEDANGSLNISNGRPALEPRKADVAVSFVGSNKTNSLGQVILQIEYPKNLGSWVRFNLVVAASGVAGSEGRANFEAVLGVAAAEADDVDITPPFDLSPYGLQTSATIAARVPDWIASKPSAMLCTNPN